MNPLDRLRPIFGPDLEELTGAVVAGEIPMTGPALDRLIAEQLAARQLPVTSVHVEPDDDERLMVHVGLRGPIPHVRIAARIERQPQLPGDAILGLRWSVPGLGPLSMLAGPVLSMLKTLPEGFAVNGDRLAIDLHALLWRQGLGDVIPLLTGFRVLTRAGRVVIQFEVKR